MELKNRLQIWKLLENIVVLADFQVESSVHSVVFKSRSLKSPSVVISTCECLSSRLPGNSKGAAKKMEVM